jgi:hypothetical protein
MMSAMTEGYRRVCSGSVTRKKPLSSAAGLTDGTAL